MLVSVIIKTKDEAARLRLVLSSLARQTIPIMHPGSKIDNGHFGFEIIVVDDGSSDETAAMLKAQSVALPMTVVRLEPNRGRAAASNAGAKRANGDVLIFLDGDTLANPEFIERHAQTHQEANQSCFGRGENCNLRCTRFFADPETGTPRPGCESQVIRMGPELTQYLITRELVNHHFEEIDRRSQPGIYPGSGPRSLYEIEWDALTKHPDLSVIWMAAAGHNASLRRSDFEAVGGFEERLTINEHRELAYRLQKIGVRVRPVVGAKSYHLTHRSGYRDPLVDKDWEKVFFNLHPHLPVKLMSLFWLSLSGDKTIPEAARIFSLPAMAMAAAGETGVDFDAVRRSHPMLGIL